MFESEIKIVGKNKIKRIPDFKKSDGDVEIGKIFICYPHEMEELQQYKTKYENLKGEFNSLKEKYTQKHETSKSLEEELESKRQTIEENEEEIESLKNQITQLEETASNVENLEREIETIKHDKNLLSNNHETQQKTIERLEDENSKKDEEIKQLKDDNSHLIEENSNLNTSNTSMKIQHGETLEHLDEEMADLIQKYNDCVDMIHSLISTTSLLKNDIENMGLKKRTFGFKKNVDSLFEERNMDGLIEQHLINGDSTIPEKLPKKK